MLQSQLLIPVAAVVRLQKFQEEQAVIHTHELNLPDEPEMCKGTALKSITTA